MKKNTSELYGLIKEHIIHAVFLPGERLIETDLAKKYNSSRFLVGEALKKLTEEGLVEVIKNKGAKVSRMSIVEITNSYDLLENLEVYAAEQALEKITKKDIIKIEKYEKKITIYYEDNDFTNYLINNHKFHLEIAAIGKNDILLNFVANLRNRNIKYSYFVLAMSDYIAEYIEQHQLIVKAFNDRNRSLLKDTVSSHIISVKNRVIENYNKRYEGL